MGMAAIVETRELTKRYGDVVGIEELSMSVERGEIFGFLGPNGAGKTTTIRTLLDLLHPTSGSARLFGLDSRRDSIAIRARLGNLPGEFSYDLRRTGRELLGFIGEVRGVHGLGSAGTLAERFGADIDRPLGQLSRGNRQKIGLIQALFHEPELLLLDEPTGGLDPLMQEEFLTLLGERREHGDTVFLSSHDLDEVERICDRVGIIRNGRLSAVERMSDLTRKSFRYVHVEFGDFVSPASFAGLPGVTDLHGSGRMLDFKVTGSLDAVIKAAAAHEVVDMELAHPTLEEIFMTYYGADEVETA